MEDEGSGKIAVSFGYLGGPGGSPWDDGVYSTVRRIVVNHGLWIDSIQIEYDDKNGKSFWSAKHGANGGSESKVVLDYPEEYIISIHGYILERKNADTVIGSLTLETNRRTYGPFGVESGIKFSFPTMGAKIVGFHGRSGFYLYAIGIYVQPIPKSEPLHFTLGQYGGKGGSGWEDVFSTIRRFVINHGLWIDSIQIEYDDKNGKSVWSDKHGGNGGSTTEVWLEYPDEYLISINGYYSDVSKWGLRATVVRSLTLETNRRSYGPFGVGEGTKFSFPTSTTGVKIVGIHGRSGLYLASIGLYAVSIQN